MLLSLRDLVDTGSEYKVEAGYLTVKDKIVWQELGLGGMTI